MGKDCSDIGSHKGMSENFISLLALVLWEGKGWGMLKTWSSFRARWVNGAILPLILIISILLHELLGAGSCLNGTGSVSLKLFDVRLVVEFPLLSESACLTRVTELPLIE